MKAGDNNQDPPSTLYAVGSEQALDCMSWQAETLVLQRSHWRLTPPPATRLYLFFLTASQTLHTAIYPLLQTFDPPRLMARILPTFRNKSEIKKPRELPVLCRARARRLVRYPVYGGRMCRRQERLQAIWQASRGDELRGFRGERSLSRNRAPRFRASCKRHSVVSKPTWRSAFGFDAGG